MNASINPINPTEQVRLAFQVGPRKNQSNPEIDSQKTDAPTLSPASTNPSSGTGSKSDPALGEIDLLA